jgi:hypothetical protein
LGGRVYKKAVELACIYTVVKIICKLCTSVDVLCTHQREDDAKENEGAAGEAGHEEERGGEHAHQRDPDVLIQLLPDYLRMRISSALTYSYTKQYLTT